MTPEQARQLLIDSLIEVRKRRHAGADDWQHSLLRTFREYAVAIGIDKKLLHSLQTMINEVDDTILKARRRKEGKAGTPMPAGRALTLSVAAAVVTVLKERGDCASVDEATKVVARGSGVDRKEIKKFRDNLNRGVYGPEAARGHENHLSEARTWPTVDMLNSLADLHRFVN